ncbi:tyrosine recombinase XerC [Pseudonocardia kongjuensis]|uniref:Tyrosine recombinase XerC n=1 Tax=Pseudonocardia kongjuensis TaxID=102227 RepID=A0ABP4ICU0_9PSEU
MAERLDDLCASFKRDLRAEGKAPRTGDLYAMSVRLFGAWLTEQGRPATLDELSRSAIREWLAALAEDREQSTVRTRFKGLHRFCGWLVAEGELDAHPMAGMSPPAPAAKPVPVLSDAELTALIKACGGRDFVSRRDAAMIRVLLETGVRVSELCGLTVQSVDLDREMALVTGKGSKVRPVYFGSRTVSALDRYLRERRRHRWAHLDAMWLTQRGALSPDGARERIKIRGREAGIDGLHPHMFRHVFAHDYLMAGGQERDLKRLAGWTSDTMLERYGASAADARAAAAARRMARGDRV